MGSFLCLPARGAFLRSSSLLHFLLSRKDECTGNGGPGSMEYSATTGRLGLGLLGLDVRSLGFGCSTGTQPRQSTLPWPWATMGLGRNGSPNVRSPRFRGQRPRLFGRRLLLATSAGVKSLPNVKELTWRAHTRARARLPGKFPLRKHQRNPVFVKEEGYPHFVRTRLLLFLLQSRSPLALARYWRHLRANRDNFLASNPTKVDH
jgi:hypothetical protein